ncbi:MAG TPA: TetR/AcrR family transcriptional regulator [Acidimicrobiales bacterium]|nr:TetR/AcrR family transcriptional regulator [Acidimicrobiales bacterium]
MSVAGVPDPPDQADPADPDKVVRRLGRPRDPAADEAIITAVFDVIEASGFAGFSVEAVAARAGVGKATIYRRWPTREDLLVAAAERVMTDTPVPDTGSLESDLVVWIWDRYRAKASSPGSRLLGHVIIEARVDPELQKMLQRFHDDSRATLISVVDRAEGRGEVGPLDRELLLDLISGALLHRSLFTGEHIGRADVEQIVDAALRGVGVDKVE